MPRIVVLLFLVLVHLSCARRESAASTSEPAPQPKRATCVDDWQPVVSGVDYRMLNCRDGQFDLHLVRVDPRVAKVDTLLRSGVEASDLGREFPVAINANFFDETYKPLGIVRSGSRDLNRLHPVSWQSIFYVTSKGEAGIVRTGDWASVRDDAVTGAQAGPRLVVDGAKNQVARADADWRSGVCVDGEKRAVFFATPQDARFDVWQTADLAMSMQCRDAMLFDGGPSTQLFVRDRASVDGDKRVPAWIIVK